MYFNFMRKGLKTLFYVLLFFSLLIFCLCTIFCLIHFGMVLIISFAASMLGIVAISILLFWGRFSYKFYIDSYGVKLIKRNSVYDLKWEDIKSIGLNNCQTGHINIYSFIYFDNGEDIINLSSNKKFNIKNFNEKHFGVQYQKEIVNEIEKYWNEPIKGVYQAEENRILWM